MARLSDAGFEGLLFSNAPDPVYDPSLVPSDSNVVQQALIDQLTGLEPNQWIPGNPILEVTAVDEETVICLMRERRDVLKCAISPSFAPRSGWSKPILVLMQSRHSSATCRRR